MLRILDERYYGGAFDIDPYEFFTMDDLRDLISEVIYDLSEKYQSEFDVDDASIDNNVINLSVSDEDGITYPISVKVDIRKIKRPSDLIDKYSPIIVNKLSKLIDNN